MSAWPREALERVLEQIEGQGRLGLLHGGIRLHILSMVLSQKRYLLVLLGEEDKDDRSSNEHRDDPGQIGILIAIEERLFGGGSDLGRIFRVLRGNFFGARE